MCLLGVCTHAHTHRWVSGLNAALFVHKRLLEQEDAMLQLKASGDFIHPKKCIYFPEKKQTADDEPTNSRNSSIVIINSNEFVNHPSSSQPAPDLVVIDVDSDNNHSSRDSTPLDDDREGGATPPPRTSPVAHKCHYKIRTIASPYGMVVSRKSPQPSWDAVSNCSGSQDWRTKTTESTVSSASCGLPYKGHKNPLASYCACHAYAIEPSSAMLVSSHSSSSDEDPFKSCCPQCRDKCRLLRDLSLF